MDTSLRVGYSREHGFHFGNLDRRHRDRFHRLVSEHAHAVNAAVSGRSALPGTATPMAATRAMTRFLNREDLPFSALIEPARDATRSELARSDSPFALVVHDRSMFAFHTHTSKRDRRQRAHDTDRGYERGTAPVVDAHDGRPLGPMELRLRTADGLLSTRVGHTDTPAGHVDEVLDAMDESRHWQLDKTPIRAIDREADSVGHYRAWSAARHRFLVRADDDRVVMWNDAECSLAEVVRGSSLKFEDVLSEAGEPAVVAIAAGTGRVRVAETEVVPHRPAKNVVPGERSASGHEKKIDVPGEPLALRLVVTRVVNELGVVLAEWCLLTNVPAGVADAATVGRWYA